MAKIKIFDNFDREVKDDSLICIIGEKNRFGFVKIVDEGIEIDCAYIPDDCPNNKTVTIKGGHMGISGVYSYEELKKMNVVVIRDGEEER